MSRSFFFVGRVYSITRGGEENLKKRDQYPIQKKKRVRIETSPAFPHEAVDITSLETVNKDNKTFVVDFNDNEEVVLQPYKSGVLCSWTENRR